MSRAAPARESRRSPADEAWSQAIKERAGWKCEGCGMSSEEIRKAGGRLEAAHIYPYNEYPKRRTDLTNGKALCTFRNRRHPDQLGRGYGCHNAVSGHWNGADGAVSAHHDGDPWELWGFGLLALSVVLGIIGFRARTPLIHIWLPYVAFVLLFGSTPMWWVKFRHPLTVLVSSLPLWGIAVTANALARGWSSLRPWTLGLPTAPGNFLNAAVVLLALWGACLILCHVALRRRWLGRAGRGIWHGLVRLARWAKP